MSCKNERIDLCVISGVADFMEITISDIAVDTAGYEFVLGDKTYSGAAIGVEVYGDGVVVTCRVLAGDFEEGIYQGYFKTLTKERSVYEQFKIQLTVKPQYGN